MNTETFWNVIADYNNKTLVFQIILMILLCGLITLSYKKKKGYIAKIALGIANLFIAVAYFATYGTEPIQRFFALPLYLISGILFLYESYKNKDDELNAPNKFQTLLLILYLVYPAVSIACGNHFPRMVTYIMPCPIVSLSIAVYSCYNKKNRLLLLMLTLWGLTGVKSLIFSVYEDLILLVCGIYGVVLLIREMKKK